MTDTQFTRRRFALTAIAACGATATPIAWLPGGSTLAATAADADFPRLARLLFPHPGLGDDVYAAIADNVFATFAANPETAALLDTAADALDSRAGGDWTEADEGSQLDALRGIEGEPFFGAILAGLRGAFYNHPGVWAHIAYPGSSKEHGGYKHRGFDDIGWLPEVD